MNDNTDYTGDDATRGDAAAGDPTGDGSAYYGPFGPDAPLGGDTWWEQDAYGADPNQQGSYRKIPYDSQAGPAPDQSGPDQPDPYQSGPYQSGPYQSGPHQSGPHQPSWYPSPGFQPDLDDTQPIVSQPSEPPSDQRPLSEPPGDWARPAAVQPSDSQSKFPAPPGVAELRPQRPIDTAGAPLPPRSPTEERRHRRPIAGLAAAGVAVLLAAGAAGYGGAALAGYGSAGAETSTAPRPASSVDPQRSPVAPPPPVADTVAIAKLVLPSTVTIQVGDRTSGGTTGSGFVLDKEGRIMTNNHVVAKADGSMPIQVNFSDGRRAEAKVLGRSPGYDLAVIKVAAGKSLVPVAIGDSAATQVGEPAIAVGSPLGLGGTVTEGIISARDRPVVVGGDEDADTSSAYINSLQTDAPINPGNSGGPLVDAGGRVIGVNSAILTVGQTDGQGGNIGLGFAIPINQAMVIGEMLIKDGKATYPVIGATVSSQTDDSGVRLAHVEAKGPAGDAGLRADDVITGIDGTSVARAENLIVTIRTHRPGDTITLTYRRGGKSSEVKVTLDGKEG